MSRADPMTYTDWAGLTTLMGWAGSTTRTDWVIPTTRMGCVRRPIQTRQGRQPWWARREWWTDHV